MPESKTDFNLVETGGKLYAIGGFTDNYAQATSILEYDPSLNTWNKVGDVADSREYPQAAVLDGNIYLGGGYLANSGTVLSDYQFYKAVNTLIHIEAEDYNNMSGIQVGGSVEGAVVGWIDTGDWLDYNITLPKTGYYQVSYRVSSPTNLGILKIGSGNSGDLAVTAIPSTGSWENWTTVAAGNPIHLTSGQQYLWIAAAGPEFNLNWLELSFLHE